MTSDTILNDSITFSMFLNYSTCKNEVIGKTDNGTLIMLYGHVKERYIERFERIKEITGIEELSMDNLMNKTCEIVNEYYYECKCKNFDKVRHVIRAKVNLELKGKKLIVDLTVLVAGSEVTYYDKRPYVIEDQYKELVESGELMVHDTILAVETINATIRMEGEKLENFSFQPTITKFKLPESRYMINEEQLVYITEHMLADKENKISSNVQLLLQTIKRNRKRKYKM